MLRQWPSRRELAAKSADELRNLRIQKVEFFGDEYHINSLRFTLSDGTCTPLREYGPYKKVIEPNVAWDIKDYVRIRRIRLAKRRPGPNIWAIEIFDQYENKIFSYNCQAWEEKYNVWSNFDLLPNHDFVGFVETADNNWITGI